MSSRAPELAGGPQSWASDLLWWAGYTPSAQLDESDVSVKPAGWTGRDEDLARVEGARLNGLRSAIHPGVRRIFRQGAPVAIRSLARRIFPKRICAKPICARPGSKAPPWTKRSWRAPSCRKRTCAGPI